MPSIEPGDAGVDAAVTDSTTFAETTSEVPDVTSIEVDASVSEVTSGPESTEAITTETAVIETSSSADVVTSSAPDVTSEGPYGPNLITNPGFEGGDSAGWGPFGPTTITAVNTYSRQGTYSGQVTGRTDGWNGTGFSLESLLVAGTTYFIEGSVRVSAASAPVSLTVKEVCGGENYVTVASGTATNTEWLDLSGTYTMATCADWTEIQFYVEGPGAGIDIFIDEMSIREVN